MTCKKITLVCDGSVVALLREIRSHTVGWARLELYGWTAVIISSSFPPCRVWQMKLVCDWIFSPQLDQNHFWNTQWQECVIQVWTTKWIRYSIVRKPQRFFMRHHYPDYNLKWKHFGDAPDSTTVKNELTCPFVSRGTKFQKSSEHSGSGSASTWAQHTSDSTNRFHSFCSACCCLTSHSFPIGIKKENKPSWLYTHSIESAVYTPAHTHWALVMSLQNTHSQTCACLNSVSVYRNVLLESGGTDAESQHEKVHKFRVYIWLKQAGRNFQKAVRSWVIPVKRIVPWGQKESSSRVPLWCKKVQWVLKKSKKQVVCELKSSAGRFEYSPVCSQLHSWAAALQLHLEKHTVLCTHIKLLTHTREEFTHTHGVFHRSWAK